VYSGHNELYSVAAPPASPTVAIVVGEQLSTARRYFASCDVAGRLDNEVGVDNEEQGQPIAVCRERIDDWPAIWPTFRHLD
jgi:hypothetical protein